MSDATDSIRSELSEGVLTIWINRPEARNALRVQDKRALTDLIREIDTDQVRVIVLTGAGDVSFCAGSDLKEMAQMDATTCLSMEEVEAALHETIMTCPVLVIAAVNGWALGTGCELTIACDLAIADPSAHFGQPEVLNGAPTPIQGALLPQIIGLGRARWLAHTGRMIDAATALDWGMLAELSAPGGALAAARTLAAELARDVHPVSMKLQKRIVDSWIRQPFDAAVSGSMYITSSAYNSGWPQSAANRSRERAKQ
jgi:enoyl-CoA hydratase/carnithine racemase